MKLRILFLTEYLTGGGAEKALCELVRLLDRDLFDVTVQSIWQGDPSNLLPAHVHYRYCHPDTKAARLRFRAEAELGLTYLLHIRDNYDIEVAFHEYAPTKILAASTNKTARKVAWVHCNLRKATKNPADFPKIEGWYRKYDQIVCVSQDVQAAFHDAFGKRLESVVHHNVLDGAAVLRKAQEPLDLPRSLSPVVCTVGRLDVPKNHLRLLRAHKQLLDEGLHHSLWIVGEGPDREKLEAYVEAHRLQDSVTLFGFQQNPYPYMRHADLLVCSSDYEGLSTFIMEGLVLGKPILTTNCGGMEELLGNSENGLITENSDSAFTDGLRCLLRDDALRREYAARALRAAERFSPATQEKTIEAMLLNTFQGSKK